MKIIIMLISNKLNFSISIFFRQFIHHHKLRDIRHDNLNAFIGACTEPPNICIITEYCSRGSLKDVLENEAIKLDQMFIASLVFDLIRVRHSNTNLKFHEN